MLSGKGQSGGQRSMRRTIAMGYEQIPERAVVALATIGEALSGRRERDSAVDIFDQQLRRAAKDGSAIQRSQSLLGLVAADAVDVAAIGRKCDARVASGRWRHYLRIAHGGEMSKPQRLQTALFAHVQKVLAILREGRQRHMAVACQVLNRKMLQWQPPAPLPTGIDAESGRGQHDQRDDICESRAELVLFCGFDDYRTAGFGSRWCGLLARYWGRWR